MTFEWDEAKNQTNLAKHGLDFADGQEIFKGPVLTQLDERFDYGEDRYTSIGFLRNFVVVAIFTKPTKDPIRFISLRKAVKHERSKYERSLKNRLG